MRILSKAEFIARAAQDTRDYKRRMRIKGRIEAARATSDHIQAYRRRMHV